MHASAGMVAASADCNWSWARREERIGWALLAEREKTTMGLLGPWGLKRGERGRGPRVIDRPDAIAALAGLHMRGKVVPSQEVAERACADSARLVWMIM